MKNKTLHVAIDEFTSPVYDYANEDSKVSDIFELMQTKGFRHIPVLKDNKPVGIISDRDLALLSGHATNSSLMAKDVMIINPYCVVVGTALEKVAYEMSCRKIGSALVIKENGELEGIFTSVDGLNALIEIIRGEVG